MVLFFVAAYVRLYPIKMFDKVWPWAVSSIILAFASIVSILACVWLGEKINVFSPYLFMTDSNNFLALATGFSLFMFFKNIKIKNNRFVNVISSATFGVLLIHANSDTMRRWLWGDLLKNTEQFNSKYLMIHAILSVIGIYIICTMIELIRIYLIEKYALKLWDKLEPKVKTKLIKIENKLTKGFYDGGKQ